MANKTATFEDVINAARAAQCHEFIEKLDKSYQMCVPISPYLNNFVAV
jgi:ATP-binding cassette subfamily B protein